MHKPKFNQTIYVPFNDETLSEETVYLKGETEFCHKSAFDNCYRNEYRQPLKYADKGITWFTSLASAKKYFIHVLKYKKIIEIEKGYWEGTN